MALITCPYCGEYITDQCDKCPMCGTSILSTEKSSEPQNPSAPAIEVPQNNFTRISNPQQSTIGGLSVSIIGAVAIALGVLFAFAVLPFGICLIVIGLILFYKGNAKMVGTQEVICPYCGTNGTMQKTDKSFLCPACRRRSVRKGDYLHTVR